MASRSWRGSRTRLVSGDGPTAPGAGKRCPAGVGRAAPCPCGTQAGSDGEEAQLLVGVEAPEDGGGERLAHGGPAGDARSGEVAAHGLPAETGPSRQLADAQALADVEVIQEGAGHDGAGRPPGPPWDPGLDEAAPDVALVEARAGGDGPDGEALFHVEACDELRAHLGPAGRRLRLLGSALARPGVGPDAGEGEFVAHLGERQPEAGSHLGGAATLLDVEAPEDLGRRAHPADREAEAGLVQAVAGLVLPKARPDSGPPERQAGLVEVAEALGGRVDHRRGRRLGEEVEERRVHRRAPWSGIRPWNEERGPP